MKSKSIAAKIAIKKIHIWKSTWYLQWLHVIKKGKQD